MESYILHCDFSGATDDTEDDFRKKRRIFEEELSSLGRDGILSIITAFQRRVCVAGFPGARSVGFDLSGRILRMMLDSLRYVMKGCRTYTHVTV
jgi:hypothetical protein